MKLKPLLPNEHRYAVAVRDGSDAWLTLWVKRAPQGDVYVTMPTADGRWKPHKSYHQSGKHHGKSFGREFLPSVRQPLTSAFKGTENVGSFGADRPEKGRLGYDPRVFSGVIFAPRGILDRGSILVDLVEPGFEPIRVYTEISQREFFRDAIPWIVITITNGVAC